MTTASPAEASTKAIGIRNRTATKIFNTINTQIMRISHFMVFTVPVSYTHLRKSTATIIMSRSGRCRLRSAARVRLASFRPISVRMEMPTAMICLLYTSTIDSCKISQNTGEVNIKGTVSSSVSEKYQTSKINKMCIRDRIWPITKESHFSSVSTVFCTGE